MTSNRHNRMDEQAVLDAARDCVLAVGVRRTTLTDIARRAGVSRMTLYRRWPDVRTIVADLMTREWTAVGDAVRPITAAHLHRLATQTDARPGPTGARTDSRSDASAERTDGRSDAGAEQTDGRSEARGGVHTEGRPVSGDAERTDGRSVRELLVDGLVSGVAQLRDHPLMRKILDVDPELLLPYLLDRLGASQASFLEIFEEALAAGHADGSIRAGDTARQARALLLVVQSFALSGRTVCDPADPALTHEAFDAELRIILERTLAP